MKKIVSIFSVICLLCSSYSCSDMLDVDNVRTPILPTITDKTDSLFYAFGIMQAMQQLADQYVLQGELRGDLLDTTYYTDNHLRELASFKVSAENRYDSATVYYRVINNCNYYIKNRDTNLYTGAVNVAINEFVAIKAIRAWAYLQLVRNYRRVPYFTEPMTKISEINTSSNPNITWVDIHGLVARLTQDLLPYSGTSAAIPPTGGMNTHETVAPNWESTKKSFSPSRCYIPVDVILGDLYLEVGNYDMAARCFVNYLTRVSSNPTTPYLASLTAKYNSDPLDLSQVKTILSSANPWSSIFQRNATNDIISYIPMAPNSQNGVTTNLPLIFGADYYATPEEQTGYTRRMCDGGRSWNYNLPLVTNIQLVPSKVLNQLSDSTEYYYYSVGGKSDYDSIRAAAYGDMRLRNVTASMDVNDNTLQWITKYDFANVVLYRNSTVLLHLAEAFNRLGMCDAAFAILKDGISEVLTRSSELANSAPYMTEESKYKLTHTYKLLTDSFISRFPIETACGIHCHGTGKAASDLAKTTYRQNGSLSPYTLDRMVGKKLDEIRSTFNVAVGETKQDTINAIEDMICDEYALELCFEGSRYYDLMRLARHKNEAGLYGSNFGSRWLATKLDNSSLLDPSRWYFSFPNK